MRAGAASLAFTLALQGTAAFAAAPEGYQVAQTMALGDGCDCTVEVLEDARITDAIRKDAAETGGGPGGDQTLYTPFEQVLPKGVAVQIVDRQGHVTDRRDFDVPLATLVDEPVRIGLPAPTAYELKVDRSRGEVMFSGPASYFFSVARGKFAWIEYVDERTHQRHELAPMITLRNSFSIVDRADGRGKDFLLIHCNFDPTDPVSGEGKFTTIYTRIHFAGGEWRAKSRTKAGNLCPGG